MVESSHNEHRERIVIGHSQSQIFLGFQQIYLDTILGYLEKLTSYGK